MHDSGIAPDVLPLRPTNDSARSPLRICLPLALFAVGFCALPLDLPISRWIDAGGCPREIGRVLNLAETYAYGFGVGAILLTALVLDWRRRAMFPRAVATVVAAGLLADIFKMTLSRARPHAFALAGSVWSTFGHWLPLNRVPADFRSFPSGHMAEAAALTAVLIWLYPRGRWMFITFALMAGGQRLYATAHFLSDVTWGAAAGTLSASWFLPGGWRAKTFDQLERFLDDRWNGAAFADERAVEQSLSHTASAGPLLQKRAG